ncbi:hypothetical protein M9Y10_040025 [Tritrichomonas musculus]|uniref:DUF3447 domain-containing protein n=1 Tax=Tritrichomonas musculus TaxID=1915356 RepID=A0ABR2GQ51_9EUKA
MMEVNIKEFLEVMKKIQKNLIDFLEHGDNNEEQYQNLIQIFEDIKIHDNQFKIKPLLYLILKISNNHHREPAFFSKIEKILLLFKDDIKKYFPNNELFHIFKSNKRLLLFLLEEKIMIFDEFIIKRIVNNEKYIESKYPQYFQPEIQPFINEKWFPKYDKNDWRLKYNNWVEDLKKELQDGFYEIRKIGENDDEICKLIQKDLIEEFIIYINKNCYPVNSTINPSIYETNNFLLKKQNITLIEYAAFFGSIQIFNYLRQNGAKLESSLWLYAVYGKDPEIINFLEENKIQNIKEKNTFFAKNVSFEQIFKESIKCHHIDVANYIRNNYLQNEKEYLNDTLISGLKYYNFMFMQCNIENETSFCYLCKYDYYVPIFILFKYTDIEINKKIICTVIF